MVNQDKLVQNASVLYLCDGNVASCRMKLGCYKNGGSCRHTSDIFHRIGGRFSTAKFNVESVDRGEQMIALIEQD